MLVICINSLTIDPYIMAQKTSKNTKAENLCKLFMNLRSYIMN